MNFFAGVAHVFSEATFFYAVAYPFVDDDSAQAVRRVWEARSVARDAWLQAGGCEACHGLGEVRSRRGAIVCKDCLGRTVALGFDPLVDVRTVQKVNVPTTVRDWQIDFGPITGLRGDEFPIVSMPRCVFRGEKIMMTDTYEQPGYGTEIVSFHVGQKPQLPVTGYPYLSAAFAPNSLGRGVKLDTCEGGMQIRVVVRFLQDCTWDCSILGKAIL